MSSPLGVHVFKSKYKRQKSESNVGASPQTKKKCPVQVPQLWTASSHNLGVPSCWKTMQWMQPSGTFPVTVSPAAVDQEGIYQAHWTVEAQHDVCIQDCNCPVTVTLDTEDQPVSLNWIPDTGSDVDAVKNSDVDGDDVHGANGTQLRSLGKICATFSTGATQHVSTIHVYEGFDDALLSTCSSAGVGISPKRLAAEELPCVQPGCLARPQHQTRLMRCEGN